MSQPVLQLRGITRRFGDTTALVDAGVSVTPGTIHMLLGENGAGKTTLLRIAAGFEHADGGTIRWNGTPVRWSSRGQARRAGIGVVEQHFSLVASMTVAENVLLASAPLFSRFDRVAANERVAEIARASGLSIDGDALVGDLSVAGQQRAEIVKALATSASVLFLDEPTAVLSPAEASEFFGWLRRFVNGGRSAVVVTHRLDEALEFGDHVTVLRAGRVTLDGPRASTSRQSLTSAILGDAGIPASQTRARMSATDNSPIAALRGVSVVDDRGLTRLRDVSIALRAGEILGVAGVEGAGQRELLRVLAGRASPSSGTAVIPQQVAFIPEDRLHEGLIPELSLVENWTLRGAGSRTGVIRWKAELSRTARALGEFEIRAAGPDARAASLSGGNQQRLIAARELADSPALVVAENPTRGLDVRAAAAVLSRLAEASASGAAVVVYSSDLEEVLRIADRMAVCYSGRVHEVAPEFDVVGAAMLGAKT